MGFKRFLSGIDAIYRSCEMQVTVYLVQSANTSAKGQNYNTAKDRIKPIWELKRKKIWQCQRFHLDEHC